MNLSPWTIFQQPKKQNIMKLLKRLYEVHSPSGHEKRMSAFVRKYCEGLPGCVVTNDKAGNLYVTKGNAETYPCVVAHLDEVHKARPKKFRVAIYKGNFLLGGDADIMRPCGIGADDKNGIWLALRLLEKHNFAKAVFFVGEEIGCVGSWACDMDFFNDCRFVLQGDRCGGTDFIDCANGTELCTNDFKKALGLSKFGFKTTNGATTDVMTLKQRDLPICCANVGCGYYNPHTIDEYTDFSELENCLAFFDHAFTNLTGVYAHKHKPVWDIPKSKGAHYGFFSHLGDAWENEDI